MKPNDKTDLDFIPKRLSRILSPCLFSLKKPSGTRKDKRTADKGFEANVPAPASDASKEKAILRSGKFTMRPEESIKQFRSRIRDATKPILAQQLSALKPTRQKRKEHLKKRKEKLIKKKHQHKNEYAEQQFIDNVPFGQVAQAPPTLTVRPKGVIKQ